MKLFLEFRRVGRLQQALNRLVKKFRPVAVITREDRNFPNLNKPSVPEDRLAGFADNQYAVRGTLQGSARKFEVKRSANGSMRMILTLRYDPMTNSRLGRHHARYLLGRGQGGIRQCGTKF